MSDELVPHRYLLDIGISKSRGLSAYTSLSQTQTLSFYSRESGPLHQTPESVSELIEQRRALGIETRLFVLIVEGSFEYLELFSAARIRADIRIFIGDTSDLERLGIQVIDENWEPGSKQLNHNDFVRPHFRN